MKQWLYDVPARIWALVVALGLSALLAALYFMAPPPPRALVLLLPGPEALAQPAARAWVEAARQEGVPLLAMTDDEFMRFGGNRGQVPGVILPDTVHRRASDLLVQLLHSYVSAGGKLLVSYDAAVFSGQADTYAAEASRLSSLVGVRYAIQGEGPSVTTAHGRVYGTRETEEQLQLRPGRLDLRPAGAAPAGGALRVHGLKLARMLGEAGARGTGELTIDGRRARSYDFFRTEAPGDAARVLMYSVHGDAVISTHRFGRGEVLFANLPLGELKVRDDGYLLEGLLSHFSSNMARLPRLVPGRQGGLALDLRIDAGER